MLLCQQKAVKKSWRLFGNDDFNSDNDPYGKRDFVKVKVDGEKYFAKIDYYNQDMSKGSEKAKWSCGNSASDGNYAGWWVLDYGSL